MTDHPLWDNHAKQGLTRGLLVPPISYPKHNCWMCLQPAKVELEVVRNGGLLCPPRLLWSTAHVPQLWPSCPTWRGPCLPHSRFILFC